MTKAVTVFAPAKLAPGVTETQMLAGAKKFQDEFVALQPGVLRRELVKVKDGEYIDIVMFRSKEDADDVIKKEMESSVCMTFFQLFDMSDMDPDVPLPMYEVIEVHER